MQKKSNLAEVSFMSKEQIKFEINKMLESFPEPALEELLNFLKELNPKQNSSAEPSENKFFEEDNLSAEDKLSAAAAE